MPRRHISQREAHENAKRLARLQQRLYDLQYPTSFDIGHVAEMRPLPVSDRYRGFIEGARCGRSLTLAARLTPEGIVVYLYEGVAG